MIKGITGGPGIQVDHGNFSLPYVPTNVSNPMQGMVRVCNQDLQVFDGSSWITMSGAWPSVSLNGVSQSAINWATIKMAEELKAKELAAKHPAVADALNAIKEAEDKLKVIIALTEEEKHEKLA